jgi:peptidoglycan/LPS O-acetylase OafA/YrhL
VGVPLRPGVSVLYLVIVTAVSIVLAGCSYYLVERPAVRLARRLGDRRSSDPEPAATSTPAAPPTPVQYR